MLPPFLQKHILPNTATITVFGYLQDTIKLSGWAQQVAWRHATSVCFFQFLRHSSAPQHVITSQVAASAHLLVPTAEALQVWGVIKRDPEVLTHADYSENGKYAAQCIVTFDGGFLAGRLFGIQKQQTLTTPALPCFPQDNRRPAVSTYFYTPKDNQLTETETTGTCSLLRPPKEYNT